MKYGLPVGINRGGFSWTYCPRIAPRCPLTARGTTGRIFAKRAVCFIFASAKRGRAQAFPLFAFLGPTILYERENYKQARKNLLLYNFSEVLYREKFLVFRGNFLGANFPFLNYL